MNVLAVMILSAALVCAAGLAVFLWCLNSGQFDDPAGDAARAVNDAERPL